jgi:hypothetical protein
VNWQIRYTLIFGSAVVLYWFLASMLAGEDSSRVALAFEKRVQALEETQGKDRALWIETQEAHLRGTLFQLLVSNASLGNDLLKGWTREQLTSELGWPEAVQGPTWIYAPRLPGGPGLHLVVGEGGQFESLTVIRTPE